jgi:hypothetical protein
MFDCRASDGEYLILRGPESRIPIVLIRGATTTTPAAALIPLDQNFVARADAALQLWRALAERSLARSADTLTQSRRRRLTLVLRALDARLAGEAYRSIARVLFGERRVPSGSAWKTHDLRDRTIRLVRTGVQLMRSGYLNLVRYTRRRRR